MTSTARPGTIRHTVISDQNIPPCDRPLPRGNTQLTKDRFKGEAMDSFTRAASPRGRLGQCKATTPTDSSSTGPIVETPLWEALEVTRHDLHPTISLGS